MLFGYENVLRFNSVRSFRKFSRTSMRSPKPIGTAFYHSDFCMDFSILMFEYFRSRLVGFQISETKLLGMTAKWNEKQRRRIQSSFRNTARLNGLYTRIAWNELWASELRYLAPIDRYFDTDWSPGLSCAFILDSYLHKTTAKFEFRILGAAYFAYFEGCSEGCRLHTSLHTWWSTLHPSQGCNIRVCNREYSQCLWT